MRVGFEARRTFVTARFFAVDRDIGGLRLAATLGRARINIDYMYVNEDDLHSMAESSALVGAREIKTRILEQIRAGAGKLDDITDDTVQSAARGVVVSHTLGKHKEAALIHALNNNTNNLTTSNDVTVGFWNASTHTYSPGGKPVNAMQVRTRRTSESESVGIGNIGNILGILTGVQKFNYTPDAIAALPARANANFAVCADACGSGCTFPNICQIPERKMVSEPPDPGAGSAANRYATTSLTNQIGPTITLSEMKLQTANCAGVIDWASVSNPTVSTAKLRSPRAWRATRTTSRRCSVSPEQM